MSKSLLRVRRGTWVSLVLAISAALLPSTAAGAVTSASSDGAVTLSGQRWFPIAVSWPPPINGTTPSGGDAVAALANAGVNLLRTGAHGVPWTTTDLQNAQSWDQAAAAHGIYTFVNLRELSRATPGDGNDQFLRNVVATLSGDAGLAMWVGQDEPWWNGYSPSAFPHCQKTLQEPAVAFFR